MSERLLRLKAVVRQIRGGRLLYPGDEYPERVAESKARGLIKYHFAEEIAEDATEPKKRAYRRRDLRAED